MILEETQIRLLPEGLANKIAAGEVVQRPASVVKELVENSLDAGATKIEVFIKDAGKTLIQIVDNGVGMGFQDALKSFARHATSKIKDEEDLFAIQTMGFRGEALASVAAVAQVELHTCLKNAESGTKVIIEAGDIVSHAEAATREGTSISIKNLFFNVPARRKFLKSPPTELKAIIDEFTRLALARPDVAFSLSQNGTETYKLKSGSLAQRIVDLLGKSFREQLAPIQEQTHFISITGYIGKPELAKGTKGNQFFFVNKRFVRSSYFHHSVVQAYQGLLEEGAHPFYAIFMELDPKALDVNVHPAKWEVKFEDEKSVYGVLNAAVRKSLSQHNFSPSLDFDVQAGLNRLNELEAGKPAAEVFHFDDRLRSEIKFNQGGTGYGNKEEQAWSRFRSISSQMAIPPLWEGKELANSAGTVLRVESALNQRDKENYGEIAPIFTLQLFNKFILTQRGEKLLLVDQFAAHFRILFEHLIKENSPNKGSQTLLFPIALELDAGRFFVVKQWLTFFKEADFTLELEAPNKVMILGVPTGVSAGEESRLFEMVLEDLVDEVKPNEARPKLMQSLAKRMAIPNGKKLTTEQMEGLIIGLFQCQKAAFTPEGQPTYTLMEQEKMEALLLGQW